MNISESKDSKYDILIVDFDKPTLQILKLFFESRGYSSCCLRKGLKSLEKLHEFIPKLIILDVMLPDISAFDLFKKIRSISIFKKTPVFYLTSIPESRVLEKLEDTKVDGLISKPILFKKLEFLIKYLK